MKGSRRRFIIAVSACLLLAGRPSLAQSTEGAEAGKHNSLTEGAWALQFAVAGNFTLTTLQGAVISLKRQLTPGHAIRLGIGGALSIGDNTNLNTSTQFDTITSTNSRSSQLNSSSIQLNLQYLWYPDPGADVNLFFGAGPLVTYSHSSSDGDIVYAATGSPSNSSVSSSESNSTALGLSGLLGAEWFAFRSFSLHAEYGASVRYSWFDSTTDDRITGQPFHSTSDRKSKGWSSPTSAVRFGVSVYF